jgi:hypothetical protein
MVPMVGMVRRVGDGMIALATAPPRI